MIAPDRALDDATWREAVAAGHDLLARKARTFRLASALLPRQLRDDIAVIYAFCRTADDLADDTADAAALDALDREVAGLDEPRPLVRALHEVAARHGLALGHARTLLAGVRSDLAPVRITDDAALVAYSYQVASTVGLLLSRVLGVREPGAESHAADLGLAMQLTNIVRDVREDAACGRVYLPGTRLAAHAATPDDVLAGRCRAAIRAVCLEVLDLADRYYESGRAGLRYIPPRQRVAIAVALEVYGAIGWRIRRTGFHPLDGRMVVPRAEKVARVGQALVLAATCARRHAAAPRSTPPLRPAPDVGHHVARSRA